MRRGQVHMFTMQSVARGPRSCRMLWLHLASGTDSLALISHGAAFGGRVGGVALVEGHDSPVAFTAFSMCPLFGTLRGRLLDGPSHRGSGRRR